MKKISSEAINLLKIFMTPKQKRYHDIAVKYHKAITPAEKYKYQAAYEKAQRKLCFDEIWQTDQVINQTITS